MTFVSDMQLENAPIPSKFAIKLLFYFHIYLPMKVNVDGIVTKIRLVD
jgi:hypothetical protein